MKIILVRYGEYREGHLNDQGKKTMKLASECLKPLVQESSAIICANIPRAIESAQIIAQELRIGPIQIFTGLYAAEESGIEINLDTALKIIDTVGQDKDIVVAVVSREYIQALSKYFGQPDAVLSRGEILILPYFRK